MSASGLGFQPPTVPFGPPEPFFCLAFLSSFIPAFLNERRNKLVAQISRSNHYETSEDVDNTDY